VRRVSPADTLFPSFSRSSRLASIFCSVVVQPRSEVSQEQVRLGELGRGRDEGSGKSDSELSAFHHGSRWLACLAGRDQLVVKSAGAELRPA
jgi:hypothetical protein